MTARDPPGPRRTGTEPSRGQPADRLAYATPFPQLTEFARDCNKSLPRCRTATGLPTRLGRVVDESEGYRIFEARIINFRGHVKLLAIGRQFIGSRGAALASARRHSDQLRALPLRDRRRAGAVGGGS